MKDLNTTPNPVMTHLDPSNRQIEEQKQKPEAKTIKEVKPGILNRNGKLETNLPQKP